MDKKEWIKSFTTGRFEGTDKNVIRFIADILYHANTPCDPYADESSEAIYGLFARGYCYYFAYMLKLAFARGEVCWHRNNGHIVWVDNSGIAYDIGGVFMDYGEGDLLPAESSLDDMLIGFKHNGEKFHAGDPRFSDWACLNRMTDYDAVSKIYMEIPKDKIDDSRTVTENAISYWYEHEPELSRKFSYKNVLPIY